MMRSSLLPRGSRQLGSPAIDPLVLPDFWASVRVVDLDGGVACFVRRLGHWTVVSRERASRIAAPCRVASQYAANHFARWATMTLEDCMQRSLAGLAALSFGLVAS